MGTRTRCSISQQDPSGTVTTSRCTKSQPPPSWSLNHTSSLNLPCLHLTSIHHGICAQPLFLLWSSHFPIPHSFISHPSHILYLSKTVNYSEFVILIAWPLFMQMFYHQYLVQHLVLLFCKSMSWGLMREHQLTQPTNIL